MNDIQREIIEYACSFVSCDANNGKILYFGNPQFYLVITFKDNHERQIATAILEYYKFNVRPTGHKHSLSIDFY